jgi:hypothetical protein
MARFLIGDEPPKQPRRVVVSFAFALVSYIDTRNPG